MPVEPRLGLTGEMTETKMQKRKDLEEGKVGGRKT